jgi:hypothetical protein
MNPKFLVRRSEHSLRKAPDGSVCSVVFIVQIVFQIVLVGNDTELLSGIAESVVTFNPEGIKINRLCILWIRIADCTGDQCVFLLYVIKGPLKLILTNVPDCRVYGIFGSSIESASRSKVAGCQLYFIKLTVNVIHKAKKIVS